MAHHNIKDLIVSVNRWETELIANNHDMAFRVAHILLYLRLLIVLQLYLLPLKKEFVIIGIFFIANASQVGLLQFHFLLFKDSRGEDVNYFIRGACVLVVESVT